MRLNIYYEEKTLLRHVGLNGEFILRGENIYYTEKTFIMRRKHLLRGEKI